jgi:hypothetical protein
MVTPPAIQQVSLSLGVERGAIAPATATNQARRERDLKTVRQSIQQNLGGPLPFNLHERHPPFNICIPSAFASQVKDIHTLLDRSLVDIVERWFSDEEAGFPGRMPLEKHEEDLLRWIDGPGSELIPRFGDRYGMWRTDYLIENDAAGGEAARICEINARIPYNGFWMAGLHEEATKQLGAGTKGFNLLNDFEVRLFLWNRMEEWRRVLLTGIRPLSRRFLIALTRQNHSIISVQSGQASTLGLLPASIRNALVIL